MGAPTFSLSVKIQKETTSIYIKGGKPYVSYLDAATSYTKQVTQDLSDYKYITVSWQDAFNVTTKVSSFAITTEDDGTDEGDWMSTPTSTAAILSGLAGDDHLMGGSKADYLNGGSGDDILCGFESADRLLGGTGDDHYVIWNGSGADKIIDEGGDADVLDFRTNVNSLIGGGFTAYREGTSLKFRSYSSATKWETGEIKNFTGTGYIEKIRYVDGAVGGLTYTINLAKTGTGTADSDWVMATPSGSLLDGAGGADNVIGYLGQDTLNGGGGNDYINGLFNNDTLNGDDGDDWLLGDVGADVLNGGLGNDSLIGGNGNDTMDGGGGNDLLAGGIGDDVYLLSGDYLGDFIVYEAANEGTDSLYGDLATYTLGDNFENYHNDLCLTDSTVVITGNAANNIIRTYSDITNSSEKFIGLAGDDTLIGGLGNDSLIGGEGSDSLDGGSGSDFLSGGAGKNRLTGGGGADKFVFDVNPTSATLQTITDFVLNTDKLVFSKAFFAQLPNQIVAGNLVLATKASDSDDFFLYNKNTSTLSYDADGFGSVKAVVVAVLTGVKDLTYADFEIVS